MTDNIQTPSRALGRGTILANKYMISSTLGEGGFGITYGCERISDHSLVAVKEYFPANLASRVYQDNKGYIVPISGKSSKLFEQGKNAFLKEADYLRRYHFLPSVVSIFEIINANGTVYMVMEYIDGITLKQYIDENGAMEFDELFSLITPVFQSLITLHGDGLLHRDISPDNLMIGTDNQLHLLDFGAARFENAFDNKTMTILLKSGYTPIEQYDSKSRQGAWTDIYALSATMYFCLTGITPPASIQRLKEDSLPSLAVQSDINTWRANAIEKGMSVSGSERFQNMESFYNALLYSPIELEKQLKSENAHADTEEKTIIPKKHFNLQKNTWKIAGLVAVCIILPFAYVLLNHQQSGKSTSLQPSRLVTIGILEEPQKTIMQLPTDNIKEPAKNIVDIKNASNTTENTTAEINDIEQNNTSAKTTEKTTEKYRVDSIEDEYDSIILD